MTAYTHKKDLGAKKEAGLPRKERPMQSAPRVPFYPHGPWREPPPKNKTNPLTGV